ncbi:MAG: tRNA 2-selenouridine(34) synthase MnmH [Rhodobacter sp.]|uniref:tRNA 2-selenouridine(34) synthase MnmH n=1 Tax=Pararhodobacter sp. TaxID=2127056 RepID=UPI001DA6EE18|nr:tRNA 2-selenouridine(34) synthase MnmH [Pararhodobacter sp.]MCB1345977.1 tRNA 2-selenouridine(34) synthase MnmH [Paracoccaceae bacterium]MCC0073168.1 tRNA 2-selenouridine(34) synthase MnmH [Rhodobacter sp.]HPD91677.1 tRNA 2-selenouridine(34) synthase MnmH [Pararhodobacter sp.]
MQRLTLTAIPDLFTLPYDEVIDVRSPSEYAEDHVPGAVNLPALDDNERARVGTVYVQDSRFLARRMGAALVARNAARHLEGYLADKPADYRPLVYCWRGGQRSGSIALILGQIGWRVGVLEGGWRAWRKLVQQALYEAPFPAPVLVLDGNTGTAKTAILNKVAALGGQVLDLEGLARHRGSLFGLEPGIEQPAQKGFESALALQMARLDPTRPVLVEAESNRIGAIRLPPGLWAAMRAAPRVEIAAPLAARAEWLTRAYADVTGNAGELAARIDALSPYQSRETIAHWQTLAQAGDFAPLAAQLMQAHYDPRYARTRLRQAGTVQQVLTTDSLSDAAQDALARRIAALLG